MDNTAFIPIRRQPSLQVDPTPTVEPLLRKQEAADVLGVSQRTLETFMHDGRLPSVKIGTCCRIDPRDLRRLIDSLKVTGRGSTKEGEE